MRTLQHSYYYPSEPGIETKNTRKRRQTVPTFKFARMVNKSSQQSHRIGMVEFLPSQCFRVGFDLFCTCSIAIGAETCTSVTPNIHGICSSVNKRTNKYLCKVCTTCYSFLLLSPDPLTFTVKCTFDECLDQRVASGCTRQICIGVKGHFYRICCC